MLFVDVKNADPATTGHCSTLLWKVEKLTLIVGDEFGEISNHPLVSPWLLKTLLLTSKLAQPATEIRFRRNGQEIVLQTEEPTKILHELTSEALAAGHELEGLEVRRASLEDVYLTLTKEEERE